MSNQKFLADQLRVAAPAAEWNASNVDRAWELAGILIRSGINDLTRLRLIESTWRRMGPETNYTPESIPGFALEYDGRKFGYLGTHDRSDVGLMPILQDSTLVAWSAAGHGNVSYRIVPMGRGFAIAPQWGSSSDAGAIRDSLKMIGALGISFVLPQAGINLGAVIGNAVMGPSLAASFPMLSSAIGNAAIGAAFNGGDIAAAAKMAALGAVGGAAGAAVNGVAMSVTDIELIGKLADAATRAAVTGRDVKDAIGATLLQNAGAAVDSFLAPDLPEMAPLPIPEIMIDERPEMNNDLFSPADDALYTPSYDFVSNSVGDGFGEMMFTQPVAPTYAFDLSTDSYIAPSFEFLNDKSYGLTSNSIGDGFGQIVPFEPLTFETLDIVEFQFAEPVSIPLPPALLAAPEPPIAPQSDPWTMADARNIINTVSAAALAAISVAKAAKGLNPGGAVNTTARYADPRTGAVTVALDTGVIQTRTPDGRITTTRPPAGQSQSTATGNVVTNNGNGTYTLVSPNGQTRVITYDPATSSGGFDLSALLSPGMLATIGGGLLLLFSSGSR